MIDGQNEKTEQIQNEHRMKTEQTQNGYRMKTE